MRAYLYVAIGIVLMVLAPAPLVFGGTGLLAFFVFYFLPIVSLICFYGAYHQWKSDRKRQAPTPNL
jgi:hypothetical protein